MMVLLGLLLLASGWAGLMINKDGTKWKGWRGERGRAWLIALS